MMPLECDVDGMLDSIRDSDLEYLSSVQDAEVFRYRKFIRGVFVIRAATAKSAAKMFYRLLDCAPAAEEGKEPMFNLLTWYAAGEYRSVVIFRAAHRSSHYFSDNEDRLVISPGCADMAGVVVTPRQEDFDKLTPELLAEVYDEVSMSEEAESLLLWRLTRSQTMLSVGIMSAKEIEFEIISDGAGPRQAVFNGGKIEYDGALYDELYFDSLTPSMMFAEPAFILYGVTIGNSFHWQRKENQKFAGALKIIVEKDALTAVNVIGVEDYLLSVISSEMKSTASEEFLKAHAVISRSWVMSLTGRRNGNPAHGCHPPVDLGNGHGTLVRLDEKAGQRHRPHRLFLKPLPKREAEAVTQQFLRQRRLTPKSMNNPRNTGLQHFLQTQQLIHSPHQVDNQRFARLAGQFRLPCKDSFLQLHGHLYQPVQPGLAHSQHLRMYCRLPQFFPSLLPHLTLLQSPRMYSYRIPLFLTGHEVIRRTVDYAETVSTHMMGMNIEIISHEEKTKGIRAPGHTPTHPTDGSAGCAARPGIVP